jgi:hypothetical protein
MCYPAQVGLIPGSRSIYDPGKKVLAVPANMAKLPGVMRTIFIYKAGNDLN